MKKFLKWFFGTIVILAIIGIFIEDDKKEEVSPIKETEPVTEAPSVVEEAPSTAEPVVTSTPDSSITEKEDVMQMMDFIASSGSLQLAQDTLNNMSILIDSVNGNVIMLNSPPYKDDFDINLHSMNIASKGFLSVKAESKHPQALEFERLAHEVGNSFSKGASLLVSGVNEVDHNKISESGTEIRNITDSLNAMTNILLTFK